MSLDKEQFENLMLAEMEKSKSPHISKIEKFVLSKFDGRYEPNSLQHSTTKLAAACCAMDVYLKIMMMITSENATEGDDICLCTNLKDSWEFSVHRLNNVIVVRSREAISKNLDGFVEFTMAELAVE